MKKVFSENPEEDLWRELLQFAYEANIRRYCAKNGHNSLDEDVINRITGSFLQAQEYYVLSEEANLHVSPLLLYYGTTNLLYGMANLLDPGNVVVKTHGMKIDIPETHNFIADTIVRFNSPRDGGVHVLSKAMGFELNLTQHGDWRFKEFLDSIAEINDDYIRCYDATFGRIIPLDEFNTPDGKLERVYFTEDNAEEVQNLLLNVEGFQQSYLNPQVSEENLSGRKFFILRHKLNGKEICDTAYSGQPYLTASHHKNGHMVKIPKFVNMYVSLYVLASLCRYHPEVWNPFVQEDSTGERLLMEKLLFYCRRMLPNMVLNRILSDDIQYLSDKYQPTNTVEFIGVHKVKELVGKEVKKQIDQNSIVRNSRR